MVYLVGWKGQNHQILRELEHTQFHNYNNIYIYLSILSFIRFQYCIYRIPIGAPRNEEKGAYRVKEMSVALKKKI